MATLTEQARESGHSEPDERAVQVAIALRAYELFEERGRECGRDLDDWLRAERELKEATERGRL